MTFSRSSFDSLAPLAESLSWSHCEGIIKDFERAWRAGNAPLIQDHLLTASDVRGALLVELVHVELEFRIKAGEAARVEDYLGRFAELGQDTGVVLDLLATEHEFRTRRGGGATLDEYASRFPTLLEAIIARLFSPLRKTIVAASQPSLSTPAPWPGVPGYEVVEQIGRGGMGIVYKAFEPKLGRHVALKFLPAEFTRRSDRLERFLREARTASALNHPHICTVHALAEHDGRPYIVMELVEGETLAAIAKRGASIAEVTGWIDQAARALAAAHAAGVVHRDVKPENIMVRPDGYVKVLDFGLARRLPMLDGDAQPGTQESTDGALLGTVAYMSPEQTRGAVAEAAADIFSLGIVLYELLTGRHPFAAGSSVATLHAIAEQPIVSPASLNPELPAALAGLVEAMLSKDERLRPTAAETQAVLTSMNEAPSQRVRAQVQRPLVHRERELELLRAAFATADAGRFQLVCLHGEPGIGKTTLAEDFLDEVLAAHRSTRVARGHCSERLADAEAYLPVIDALDSLVRSDDTGAAARALKLLAPSWHAQIAPATDAAQALPPRAGSQQAMLREFCAFMDQASRLSTVVLFFDDVHWSDNATVDLLAHLGRQCANLRVFVLATYRPTEMLLGKHPFRGLQLELQGHGQCTEVPLEFLARTDIDDYLQAAFPQHAFPAELAGLIHVRTEGSPLFMADLVRYLRERGVIAEVDGRWIVAREMPDLSREIPESVRGMIERKLDRLEEGDRRLLTAAAVLGHEFESLLIADALEQDPAWVEERLHVLDRVHGLVRLERPHELPDKSLSTRYAFVHILYQQALYHQLLPTRRAQWSLALAKALENHYGEASPSATAELACLYEVGRDSLRAADRFSHAAQHAARLYAHHESAGLARRGIKLLDSMQLAPERDRLELRLQTTLGLQLQVTEGYGSPLAERAYRRGRELCREGTPETLVFPVLWGLWLCNKVRNDLANAQVLAQELALLARQMNDPDLALQAHQALGMTALCRGDQESALLHVEQAAALYDPKRHHLHAYQFGQDPGVICKALGAVTLWLLGYPDAATRQSIQAIRMAEPLAPISQAVAYYFASSVHQLRRDPAAARRDAGICHAISKEHRFMFWLAASGVILGWAESAAGNPASGIQAMRQALVDWQATGSVTYRTYYLGLLAEALMRHGEAGEARSLLEESLALVERSGERFYEAELYRLLGDVNLATGGSPDEASLALRRALHIAQRQNVRSLELRANMSLVQLERQLGDASQSEKRLRQTLRWFTQGHETADLRAAMTL